MSACSVCVRGGIENYRIPLRGSVKWNKKKGRRREEKRQKGKEKIKTIKRESLKYKRYGWKRKKIYEVKSEKRKIYWIEKRWGNIGKTWIGRILCQSFKYKAYANLEDQDSKSWFKYEHLPFSLFLQFFCCFWLSKWIFMNVFFDWYRHDDSWWSLCEIRTCYNSCRGGSEVWEVVYSTAALRFL